MPYQRLPIEQTTISHGRQHLFWLRYFKKDNHNFCYETPDIMFRLFSSAMHYREGSYQSFQNLFSKFV